jgi:hypothetical protein
MLRPDYIIGLIDGEGYFGISISKNKNIKTGYIVYPRFGICMNRRELSLIKKLKKYFNCGTIVIDNKGMVNYNINGVRKMIDIVIPFFNKHKLQSAKIKDFVIFKKIIKLLNKNWNLSKKEIRTIQNLRNKMHRYIISTKIKKFINHKHNCKCPFCLAHKGYFNGKNNPNYGKKHPGLHSGKDHPNWKGGITSKD